MQIIVMTSDHTLDMLKGFFHLWNKRDENKWEEIDSWVTNIDDSPLEGTGRCPIYIKYWTKFQSKQTGKVKVTSEVALL